MGPLIFTSLKPDFTEAIIFEEPYDGCNTCGERFSCPVAKTMKNEPVTPTAAGLPVVDRLYNHLESSNQELGQVLFRFPGLLEAMGCSESSLYRIARESGCMGAKDKALELHEVAQPDQCRHCGIGCRMSELVLPVAQGRRETRQVNEQTPPNQVLEFLLPLQEQDIIRIDNENITLAIGGGRGLFEKGVFSELGVASDRIWSIDSQIRPDKETGMKHINQDIMSFLAEQIIQQSEERFTFATMFGVEFLFEQENNLSRLMFEMLHHLMTHKAGICINSLSFKRLEHLQEVIADLFEIHTATEIPVKNSLAWVTSNTSVVLIKNSLRQDTEAEQVPIDTFDGKPSLPIEESIRILRHFGLPESMIQSIKDDRAQLSERAKYLLLEHHLDAIPEDRPITDEDHWSHYE